ncbi:hypothetical protein CAI21_13970 [Alkalilimnicola ehrlichii]|uniref:Uncharacterized protein n=1 Tax=Alkalilimnicola ehrlichii TaxID=351052 RepID=A0A3E0WNW7_9GAMM|nr:hypothetical protein CAI21_13970 [Alkalilimnicola ehrlichii]RFA34670.1 hypothetical protein CAL65_15015 [Alkalilimnicola ehrlichii]
MDRPYCDHGAEIAKLAAQYRVKARVVYLREADLPSLLRHAQGTVTINSTVGLSSLHHKTPVKVLGKAVYDIPGLVAKVDLDQFWTEPGTVDSQLYKAFRRYLVTTVLANGNFYRRVHKGLGLTGVAWPLGTVTATCRGATPPRTVRPGSAVAADSVSGEAAPLSTAGMTTLSQQA